MCLPFVWVGRGWPVSGVGETFFGDGEGTIPRQCLEIVRLDFQVFSGFFGSPCSDLSDVGRHWSAPVGPGRPWAGVFGCGRNGRRAHDWCPRSGSRICVGTIVVGHAFSRAGRRREVVDGLGWAMGRANVPFRRNDEDGERFDGKGRRVLGSQVELDTFQELERFSSPPDCPVALTTVMPIAYSKTIGQSPSCTALLCAYDRRHATSNPRWNGAEMNAAAVRTGQESSGWPATDTREIWTDLDESGQIWTNSDTGSAISQPTAADQSDRGGILAAQSHFGSGSSLQQGD